MLVMKRTDGPAIGARLKAERDRLGWTQQQLAIQAGVDRSWIAAVEAGNTDEPSAVRLVAAADAMGIDLRYLLTGVRPDEFAEPDEREPFLRRIARAPLAVVKMAADVADRGAELLGTWTEPDVAEERRRKQQAQYKADQQAEQAKSDDAEPPRTSRRA